MLKLIENAKQFKDQIAITDKNGNYSYSQLLINSQSVASQLLGESNDLRQVRIAFVVDPSFEYVSIQWGIWRAGGIAVPLCTKHPFQSIKYVIEDTEAEVIIYSDSYYNLVSPFEGDSKIKLININSINDSLVPLPDISTDRRAMILYTSGTTGNPKGVVSTHANIETQIQSLTVSWEWQKSDHILNVLPLHHVHGIINVLSCALWSGACNEFLTPFSEASVFEKFVEGRINLFMAVPTIYYKLIAYYNSLNKETQLTLSKALKKFRLMVSGSAALPITVLEQWQEISSHILLERYGMTEMGMAISNPYRGERRPGHIGQALSGVEIRIADEDGKTCSPGSQGEIQVKGANIFKEYWRKQSETKETFTHDGWFKTGDIAVLNEGYYKILGRNSVDIIKSGGYKISALEIEEVLRTHPQIQECGVVGIPDDEWGEIIGASLITGGIEVDLVELKAWLEELLPRYKIPRKYIFQDDLPRNVMGKVTKKELVKMF